MPEPEVTILANLPVHHAIQARSRMHSARWTGRSATACHQNGTRMVPIPSSAWKRVSAPPLAPLSSSWRKSAPCARALARKALIQPTSIPPGARGALDRRGYPCAGLSASTRSPNGAGGGPVACAASVGCTTALWRSEWRNVLNSYLRRDLRGFGAGAATGHQQPLPRLRLRVRGRCAAAGGAVGWRRSRHPCGLSSFGPFPGSVQRSQFGA